MFEQISGSIYAVSEDQLRIDRRCVYLRGQTVDVGSYGGLYKHPRLLALKEGSAHLYSYQISGLKQRAAGKPEILGRKKRVENELKREDLKEDTKYNGLRIL